MGVLIGGSTIHSWAGIGLGEGTVEEVVEKVRNSKDARKRWREHDALVIDEVSMIDGALLVRGILARGAGGIVLLTTCICALLNPNSFSFLPPGNREI